MEQQNQVQTLEDTQEFVWNEARAKYSYNNGVYSIEGLEGFYMSISSLRDAWIKSIKDRMLNKVKKMFMSCNEGKGFRLKTHLERCLIREEAWKIKDKWGLWLI